MYKPLFLKKKFKRYVIFNMGDIMFTCVKMLLFVKAGGRNSYLKVLYSKCGRPLCSMHFSLQSESNLDANLILEGFLSFGTHLLANAKSVCGRFELPLL